MDSLRGFLRFWGMAARRSSKWGVDMVPQLVAWVGVVLGAGWFFASKPFIASHQEFGDWLTNDYNWQLSIILLIISPFLYLPWAAYKIYEKRNAEATDAENNLSTALAPVLK
ncbi:MAG: hypothetical protein ABSH19_08855, partial [Opitutales bacterium]